MSAASTGAPQVGGCQPWGAAASLGWAFLAVALWLGAQIALGELSAEWFFGAVLPGDAGELAVHAPFVATVTIGAVIMPLIVIAFAVRVARCDIAGYLGLHWSARRYVLWGVLALGIMIPLVDLVSWLAGYAVTPEFVTGIYRSARDTGTLLLLAVALVIAAPLVEETIFRGFLLPGLAQSVLRPAGAILFTSVAWALLHAQYQPFYLLQIIVLGVVFGWLRLRSGSTALTMVLHGLLNLIALLQAALIVEYVAS